MKPTRQPRRDAKRHLVSLLAALLLALLGVVGLTGTAWADETPLLQGSAWLSGQGVNVCAPSTDTTCGGQTHVGGVSGNRWQCVELAQRLYKSMGWYGGIFANVSIAADIYNNAAGLGMTRQANGSVTSIVPGDMIVTSPSSYDGYAGHVSLVDYVDGSTVHVIDQDTYNNQPRGTYSWSSGTLTRTDNTTGSVMGVVHSPNNPLTNNPPPPPPWSGVGTATYLGNQLTAGQQMHSNQYIMSPDGRFVLIMQQDGNLVEYTSGVSGSIWETATNNNPGDYLVVQSDGNVVIYASNGATALWDTGPQGTSKFVVQDDEDVVGYNSTGQAVWANGKSTNTLGLTYQGSDTLLAGVNLTSGHYLRSSDGLYFALMQSDGNLVVYQPGYIVTWNSGTQGNPGAWLGIGTDGNAVIYSSSGTPIWNTTPESIGRFVIQTDGSLVGWSSLNTTEWVMGSFVGKPWPGVGTATYLGNQLTAGQQMHSNQYIMSPNGNFVLIMQSDGNLAEYTSLGPIWSTETTGNSGDYLVVQSDGNLVIYASNGTTALWDTGQVGVAKLAVQDDENIVGYNSSGTTVWDSGIGVSPPLNLTYQSDNLVVGVNLTSRQYLRSADGRYFSLMQPDGNFVVYAPGYRVLWSAGTGGNNAGAYLTVQSDGNLVVYASNGTTALWDTGQVGVAKLVMQSDGNLVGLNAAGTAVWSTKTTGML